MNLRTDTWDALIVGAGVAGACTAALLADRGWSVLLVEKSAWPRVTVCGGCLSADSVNTLKSLRLQHVLADAQPTHSVQWYTGKSSYEHPIPRGAAILRKDLDAAIVNQAVQRGADFIPHCQASLSPAAPDDPFRSVMLISDGQSTLVRARLVIACDGIDGSFLKHQPWADWTISRNALIGLATTYPSDSAASQLGKIRMSIGKHGYIGRVAIDTTTEHLAASLDPVACRQQGGPLNLIREILRSCQQPVPASITSARFHGKGKLTRYRKLLGTHRILTVGDSCGYVEPVTGEGMAWAMQGAVELDQLLPADLKTWPSDLPAQWQNRYARFIGSRQRWCRLIRTTAHHPAVARTGIFLANAVPAVAYNVARHICQPARIVTTHDSNGPLTSANVAPSSPGENPGNRNRQPTGGNPAGVT